MKQDVFLGLQMNAPPLNKVVSPSRPAAHEPPSTAGPDGEIPFREVLSSRIQERKQVATSNAGGEPSKSEPSSVKKADKDESAAEEQAVQIPEEQANPPTAPEEERAAEDAGVSFRVDWATLNLRILEGVPVSLLPVENLQDMELQGRVGEDENAAQMVGVTALGAEHEVPSPALQRNAKTSDVPTTSEDRIQFPKEGGKRAQNDSIVLPRISMETSHISEASPREEHSGQASAESVKGEATLRGAGSQPVALFKVETPDVIAAQGVRNHPVAAPVQQVVRAVDLLVRMDQSSMRLQLYPESLGRIEVHITQGPQGTGVTIVAEQPQTERLLLTNLNELRQSLAQSGVQLAELAVGQQNAQGGFFRQPHGTPQRLRFNLAGAEAVAEAERMPLPLWFESPSSIEYRI